MNPWDVLSDERLVSAARAEFGSACLNVFYSNPDHTLREGAIYVAAKNPAGDPRSIETQTREKPLGHPPRAAQRADWSKLLDEQWPDDKYRTDVSLLAGQVLPGGAAALREAFCTNALFMRGPSTHGCTPTRWNRLWAVCRPWHERWLRIVKPRVILCFGNGDTMSAYASFQSLVEDLEPLPTMPTYNNYSVKACLGRIGSKRVTVVSTPAPGHWKPSAPASAEALRFVHRLIADAP